jgi:hypothetical protein
MLSTLIVLLGVAVAYCRQHRWKRVLHQPGGIGDCRCEAESGQAHPQHALRAGREAPDSGHRLVEGLEDALDVGLNTSPMRDRRGSRSPLALAVRRAGLSCP